MTAAAVVLLLALCGMVLVHELAHALAARAVGMTVVRFSLGVGPLLFRRKFRGMLFEIRPIPLLGFTQIMGMGTEEEELQAIENARKTGQFTDEETARMEDQTRWYRNKSGLRQLAVLSAGSITNVIMGLAALSLWIMVTPLRAPVSPVTFERVIPGLLGEKVGLRNGDTVLEVNGRKISTVQELNELRESFAEPGRVVPAGDDILTLLRNGRRFTIAVRHGVPLGVLPAAKIVHVPVLRRIEAGVMVPFVMIRAIPEIIIEIVTKTNLDTISGPVEFTREVAEKALFGWSEFLLTLSSISFILGLLNLLPIPALDGGHIIFATVKVVLRKEVNLVFQRYAAETGFVMLMMLMLIGIGKDVANAIYR